MAEPVICPGGARIKPPFEMGVSDFDFIRQTPKITIKELVDASGYPDGYVRKILASLKEKKIIERQGGNKTGRWVVIK